MNDLETVEIKGEGNTSPPPKRAVPSKRWCFTLNNPSETDLETLVASFTEAKCLYVIGREVGEQGTPHLQGYIESEVKIRPIEKFKTTTVHWEKCKGSREDNLKYCTKDGDYVTSFKVKRQPKILKHEDLRPWQLEIDEICKGEPDERTIHWYWEPTGMAGKTTFAKYLSYHYGAIPLEGKKNDVLYAAAEYDADVYIWDLERSMEDFVSYAAIEKIKNGYFLCAKYESKPIIRANPHVVIFANFPPNLSALSQDRWHVVKIEQAGEAPAE